MTDKFKTINVLTIAGSDSSSGAGIQADLKTIHSLGGFAVTAITAITAQNTTGVSAIMPVSAGIIHAQLSSLYDDIPIHAIKIGMLFNEAIIDEAINFLDKVKNIPIVIDPVMVATSGSRLLEPDAEHKLIHHLLTKATIITPNLKEAAVISSEHKLKNIIYKMKNLFVNPVLIKDIEPDSTKAKDLLIVNNKEHIFLSKKIISNNTHGTGCTLSSAIATYLAQQLPLIEAVSKAKRYIEEKILLSQPLVFGQGHGPLLHLPIGVYS